MINAGTPNYTVRWPIQGSQPFSYYFIHLHKIFLNSALFLSLKVPFIISSQSLVEDSWWSEFAWNIVDYLALLKGAILILSIFFLTSHSIKGRKNNRDRRTIYRHTNAKRHKDISYKFIYTKFLLCFTKSAWIVVEHGLSCILTVIIYSSLDKNWQRRTSCSIH